MKNKIVSVLLIAFLVCSSLVTAFTVNVSATTREILNEMEWNVGAGSNVSGKVDNNASYQRTQKFNVSGYDNLTFVLSKNASHNVFWYDKDQNFIKAETPNSSMSYVASGSYSIKTEYHYCMIFYASSGGAMPVSLTLNAYPTIDDTRTGEIRIHKYECKNGQPAGITGTGYEAQVPDGATPLNGVTFTAKRVVAIDSTGIYYYNSSGTKVVTSFYDKTGTNLPTADTVKTYKVLDDTGAVDATAMRTQTTAHVGNEDGVATFSNLPLGIYLIQETSAPSHVTEKVPDFVVSVPSTNSSGTAWKYDFDVYPKNRTKYVDLTVYKADYFTGYRLGGAEFTLERKENNVWTEYADGHYTTSLPHGSAGGFIVYDLPVGSDYRLTETKAPDVTGGNYILDCENNQTTFSIDSTGAVTNLSGPADKLDDSTIQIKNSRPEIEKFIDKSRGNCTNLVKGATSLVRHDDDNDFQYYVVKVKTPHLTDITKLKVFRVTDVIRYTAVEPTLVKVIKGTASSALGTVLDSNAYTFTASTSSDTWDQNYTTILNFKTSALESDSYYYVVYKAYLVTTVNNQANLVYSKSTSSSETKTNGISSNIVKYVRYGYKFTKTKENHDGLVGAQFKVYATKSDAEANRNPLKGILWEDTDGTNTWTTLSDGTATMLGCFDLGDTDNGQRNFWLAETKAPKGYSLLSEPIEITVNANSHETSQMDIVNTKTLVFPFTGGIGMYSFIIVGIVFLVISALIFVFIRKKHRAHTH